MRKLGLAFVCGLALSVAFPRPLLALKPYETWVHATKQKLTDFLWVVFWAINPIEASREQYGEFPAGGAASGSGKPGESKPQKCKDCKQAAKECSENATYRRDICIQNVVRPMVEDLCNRKSVLLPNGGAGNGPTKTKDCEWDPDTHKPKCYIRVDIDPGCAQSWTWGMGGGSSSVTSAGSVSGGGGLTAELGSMKLNGTVNMTVTDTYGQVWNMPSVVGLGMGCNVQMNEDTKACAANIDCNQVCN